MHATFEFLLRAVLIGAGATVVMDLWTLFLKRAFQVPALDYAMVGRWVGHFPRGRFMHERIAAAQVVPGEKPLGWAVHYLTGIVFAAALLAVAGHEWAREPTLLPALLTGVLTVAAPFFIMQPSLGAGIAASKTPQPNVARLRSLATHTVFGCGLYLSALLVAKLPG